MFKEMQPFIICSHCCFSLIIIITFKYLLDNIISYFNEAQNNRQILKIKVFKT